MVEPVDPFERGLLNGFEAAPRSSPVDHFGFVEAVDRLGQRVIVAADRWFDPGLGEALGVFDRNVLRSTVAMMNETASMGGPAVMKRLFRSIEDEAGMRRRAGAPAYDPFGVGIDDKGDVDEPRSGRDVPIAVNALAVSRSMTLTMKSSGCFTSMLWRAATSTGKSLRL